MLASDPPPPPKTPGAGSTKSAGTARSRFSKALPVPPPPDTQPPSKALPSLPVKTPMPPVPPLKALARKPVRKPVPASDKSSSASQSSSAPLPPPPEPTQTPASQSVSQLETIISPPQPDSKPAVDSFLPPIPRQAPMSIPRRPVLPPKEGSLSRTSSTLKSPPSESSVQSPPESQSQAQSQPQSQSQSQSQSILVPRAHDEPEASPSYSFGSILSAYSRSSMGEGEEEEESMYRSSDGMGGYGGSESTLSPDAHDDPAKAAVASKKEKENLAAALPSTVPEEHKDVQVTQNEPDMTSQGITEGNKTVEKEKDLPLPPFPVPPGKEGPRPGQAPGQALGLQPELGPPPPRKDTIYVSHEDAPATAAAIANASPPREQIWRRRSIKLDRPIQLPDLKLGQISHGSTATSLPSQPSQSSQPPSHAASAFSPSPLTAGTTSQASKQSAALPSSLAPRSQPASSQPAQPVTTQLWHPPTKPYKSPTKPTQPVTAAAAASTQPSQPSQFSKSDSSSHSSPGQFKAYGPPSGNAPPPIPSKPEPANNIQESNAEIQRENVTMGNEKSSLKSKFAKFGHRHFRKNSEKQDNGNLRSQSESAIQSADPPPRLPTPDYQKQDVKPTNSSVTDTVTDPASPGAHPPTPPNEESKPQKPRSNPSIQRKAVGAGAGAGAGASSRTSTETGSDATVVPPKETQDLRAAKSLPQMNPGAEPFPKADAPVPDVPQMPPTHGLPGPVPRPRRDSSVGSRGMSPGPGSRRPMQTAPHPSTHHGFAGGPQPRPRRDSSVGSRGMSPGPGPRRRPFGPGPGPGPGPRPVMIPDVRELRQEDLPAPDPKALYFPKTVLSSSAAAFALEPQPSPNAAETGPSASLSSPFNSDRPLSGSGAEGPGPGAIYKPLPLKAYQRECHMRHRVMRPSRNRIYPLACQTCEKADSEDRWLCAGCGVRVCGACWKVLEGNGRDIGLLLEGLGAA